MPSLSPNQCIVPHTMNLTFKFKNSNTKSWFKNNLGHLLCEGLNVRIGGEVVYDNTGESTLEVHKDLWKSQHKRKTGEAVEGYKLTDINLEYETIESKELAKEVKGEYKVGR